MGSRAWEKESGTRKSRGRLWYVRYFLGGVTIWCCDFERMLDEFAARIVLDNRVPRMQTSARPRNAFGTDSPPFVKGSKHGMQGDRI